MVDAWTHIPVAVCGNCVSVDHGNTHCLNILLLRGTINNPAA